MARINRGRIEALEPHEVFVYGSNLAGLHNLGAARLAKERYGARHGVGQGLTGQSYALPTKDGLLRVLPLEAIGEQMQRLGETATAHPDRVFYLTRVGQGLAGYDDGQIRPLIEQAGLPANVKPYWEWESSGGGVGGGEGGHRFSTPGQPAAGYRAYAGIGSRETPADVMALMQRAAAQLEREGFTLRSGGAQGADSAFEVGASPAMREIYLPWNGFQGKRGGADGYILSERLAAYQQARDLASQFYHSPQRMNERAIGALMSRNSFQIMGQDMESPVEAVLAWTRGGSGSGGTGQALRIAKAKGIPIFDLGNPEVRRVVEQRLEAGEPLFGGVVEAAAGPRRVQLELPLDGGGSPPPPPPPPPPAVVMAEPPEPQSGPGPAPQASAPPPPPPDDPVVIAVQEDPKRKAGDLLPWLLAAAGGAAAGGGLAYLMQQGQAPQGGSG